MADPRPPARATAPAAARAVRPATEFAELRSLIVGPEQRQLRDAPGAARRSRPRRPATSAAVLPQAMLLRKDDPQLTRALAPTVEEAITTSVRRNPQPLADALFPVIGPGDPQGHRRQPQRHARVAQPHARAQPLVARRPVAAHGAADRQVVRRGRAAQHAGLPRRAGVPDRARVRAAAAARHAGPRRSQDADMVSGMLTAIRDFAHDSFRVSEDEALETLQVGDLSVWIEQGPHAILAAVIRGTAPPELRTTLQEALEHVHAGSARRWRRSTATRRRSRPSRPALEALPAAAVSARRRRSPLRCCGCSPAASCSRWRLGCLRPVSARPMERLSRRARAEPGIVVVSAERRGGRYVVSGLRDPLARDPSSLVARPGSRRVGRQRHWQLYQALDPALVLARARQLLRAPEGVTLRFADGVLTAGGSGSARWIVDSQRLARRRPGCHPLRRRHR